METKKNSQSLSVGTQIPDIEYSGRTQWPDFSVSFHDIYAFIYLVDRTRRGKRERGCGRISPNRAETAITSGKRASSNPSADIITVDNLSREFCSYFESIDIYERNSKYKDFIWGLNIGQ